MNTLKLEVVRFGSEDVIATSIFKDFYFTTKSEYKQAEPYSDPYGDYIILRGEGTELFKQSETDSPFGKYAWYDTKNSEWRTNNKIADFYYNSDTGTYKFPTGGN